MCEFNKIRILWIDDLPHIGEPVRSLGDYDDFFKVVCTNDEGENDSVKSIEEFNQLLKVQLSPNEEPAVFPVEIVAIDYDLSKHNPSRNKVGKREIDDASDADEGNSNEGFTQSESQSLASLLPVVAWATTFSKKSSSAVAAVGLLG